MVDLVRTFLNYISVFCVTKSRSIYLLFIELRDMNKPFVRKDEVKTKQTHANVILQRQKTSGSQLHLCKTLSKMFILRS